MKTAKVVKISLSTIGALLLAIILLILFWLGPTVKMVVQKIGTKALGTEVQIEKLSINPRNGTVNLAGFTVANPEVFGRTNAVSLTSLDIAIDMGSLFSDTVVVHQIKIHSPHFIYEQSAASDNISEFISNIQHFADIDPNAPPKEKSKKSKKPSDPKQVIVELLEINDVQIHLANTEDPKLDIDAGFAQLSISMTNGMINLNDFYVSNPGRLSTTNLFWLDEVSIKLEPSSIYSSNIVIHAINIESPTLFVEQNAETDTVAEFLTIANTLLAKIPTNAPVASATNNDSTMETTALEPTPPAPTVTLNALTLNGLQLNLVNMEDPELDIHLRLDQLSAAPIEGKIELSNFYLTNPKRLQTSNVFSLETVSIEVDPDSLTSKTVVINDVKLLKPHAFLELNKDANTVGEFLKIATGYINRIPMYEIPTLPAPPSSPVSTEKAQNDSNAPAPFELHNLLVDDIQIKLLDTTPTNNIPTAPRTLAGIESVSIKLLDGELRVSNIHIQNSPGFTATNVFHLANIDISLTPSSIYSDQVEINKVFINSLKVDLEQTENSGNVAELQHTLMQFVPNEKDLPARPAQETDPASPASTNAPLLLAEQPAILHHLQLSNLNVNLILPTSTNSTESSMIGMLNPIGKLNPMDKLKTPMNLITGTEQEKIDPNAPMTLVAFDDLNLKPMEGTLSITNMFVSNPPGFSRKKLIHMNEFKINLDPDTLQADTLLIREISIKKPRIRYERQIMSDNIKALQKEIEQAVTRKEILDENSKNTLAKAEEPDPSTDDEVDAEEQKVVIEHLIISGGLVQAKLSALPSIPVPLPTIELNDIGKKEGGASAKEATTEMVDTVYETIIGSVGSATGFAGDALKGAGSMTMGALGGALSGAENLIGRSKDTPEALENSATNSSDEMEPEGKEEPEKPEEPELKEEKKRKKRRVEIRRSALR